MGIDLLKLGKGLGALVGKTSGLVGVVGGLVNIVQEIHGGLKKGEEKHAMVKSAVMSLVPVYEGLTDTEINDEVLGNALDEVIALEKEVIRIERRLETAREAVKAAVSDIKARRPR